MGNKKWTRVLALCLAVVCTFTVVAAASGFEDVNKDGKYTVWDLQALFAAGSENYEATLEKVLGGKDELNPKTVNGETVYYIHSALGLRNMAKKAKEGCTFVLENDIDLGGADWTPVKDFKGTFNGNGKTISNFIITESATGGDGNNMGFFGSTANADNSTDRTVIDDLHLREVTIYADGTNGDADADPTETKVRFVGAVVGTNRGDVKNCSAVSVVVDKRAEINFRTTNGTTVTKAYYGALVGRNTTNNGTVSGTNEMYPLVNIAEQSLEDNERLKLPEDLNDKVNSMMATFFPENNSKEDYEKQKAQRQVGIVGEHGGSKTAQNLLWQDLTNRTDLAGEGLQTRRETVADEMYRMCTEVFWKPHANLVIKGYANATEASPSTTNNIYGKSAGTVYRGIPYNHGSSGMDRFLSWLEDTNGDGVYTTKSTLPTTGYYMNNSYAVAALNEAYGKYTAKDATAESKASLLATWPQLADMTAEATINGHFGYPQYIGADCSTQAGWAWRKVSAVSSDITGFARAEGTNEMYPTYGNGTDEKTNNIERWGIVPVNGMTFDYASSSKNKDLTVTAALVADMGTDKIPTYFWDTLALTSKGDLLMNYVPDGGHTKVAQGDAVVIRTYNGIVDGNKSYIYTMEQGASGADSDGTDHYKAQDNSWTSTCCVNRRTTFADLTTNRLSTDETLSGAYFPITCDALRTEDSAAAQAVVSVTVEGLARSSFHIVCTNVGGELVDGEIVGGETKYTGVKQNGHRGRVISVTLGEVHGEIANGTSVIVRLANGKNYQFTYGTYHRYVD